MNSVTRNPSLGAGRLAKSRLTSFSVIVVPSSSVSDILAGHELNDGTSNPRDDAESGPVQIWFAGPSPVRSYLAAARGQGPLAGLPGMSGHEILEISC